MIFDLFDRGVSSQTRFVGKLREGNELRLPSQVEHDSLCDLTYGEGYEENQMIFKSESKVLLPLGDYFMYIFKAFKLTRREIQCFIGFLHERFVFPLPCLVKIRLAMKPSIAKRKALECLVELLLSLLSDTQIGTHNWQS